MKTGLLKRSALVAICLLLLCMIVPTTNVQAANVTRSGLYSANVGTKKSAMKVGAWCYLKKVKASGSKVTTYGTFDYLKAKNRYDTYEQLSAAKRTFKLTKSTKYYLGSKRISKSAAFKKLKKLNSKYDVTFVVKSKKVSKIILTSSKR